jgi:predicted DNA-binding transcriptional regulator YafY
MDKTTRIYKLHRLLANRRTGVSMDRIMIELESSRATASRVIREMRDEFMAPLIFDENKGGYILNNTGDQAVELPGVWFSEQELLALLTMERLLAQIGSRYLTRLLAPIRDRVEGMLGGSENDIGSISNRIRLMEHMQRRSGSSEFERVAAATLQGLKLAINYHGRQRDQLSSRVVSPQRLTHYRGNLYLDAWCEQADALRRFSLDRIRDAAVLTDAAKVISVEALTMALDGGYGAFTGPAVQVAVLRFKPEHARWAADERWHPEQTDQWLSDGRYELTVPFGHAQELLMDIQRYGPGVEVVSPPDLRQAMRDALRANLDQYLTNT